jgi:hypothetical protein
MASPGCIPKSADKPFPRSWHRTFNHKAAAAIATPEVRAVVAEPPA